MHDKPTNTTAFKPCDCGSTDGRHPIDCGVFRRRSSVSCNYCGAVKYDAPLSVDLIEHDEACPVMRYWFVQRRPWGPAWLCTRARTRRDAAALYRSKLRREGEKQPLVLFVSRWKEATR